MEEVHCQKHGRKRTQEGRSGGLRVETRIRSLPFAQKNRETKV